MINKVVHVINEFEPDVEVEIKGQKNENIYKDSNKIDLSQPKEHIHDHNCGCDHSKEKNLKKIKISDKKRIIVGIGIYLVAILFGLFANKQIIDKNMIYIIKNSLFFITYIILGGKILKKAFGNISRGQFLDENFLMSLATIGAFSIGEFAEAAGVMLFYNVGEYLQEKAVDNSKKNIESLMEIRPESANLIDGDKVKIVNPDDVKVGDIILIKVGEKIPLDGIVYEGETMLDTSSMTGESVFVRSKVGDMVISGVINKTEVIKVKVSKTFENSTVSKILDLVENANSKKAKTENFITVFAKYYTPIVVVSALLVAIVPILFFGMDFKVGLSRALIFLVVSCPCALVLSIPLSYFSGIGVSSKNGILIKGGNYLEAIRYADTIVFDKTGTLTKGVFKVNKIETVDGVKESEVLKLAAIAEQSSNHPIAKSIVDAYINSDKTKANTLESDNVQKYKEIAAYGIKMQVDDDEILAGNAKLMNLENVKFKSIKSFKTVVYIAKNKKYMGCISISDEIKAGTKEAIDELKQLGVKQIVMLTGDNENAASEVAKTVGVDKYYSGLLPNDKVEKMEQIFNEKNKKQRVVFVGDGINDAPVLARADVGVAMGGVGSDAAIEASDIVLMTDEISKLGKAIKISKRTNLIVWQNIVFAIGIKLIVLSLGALGMANMWEAIFADVGVSLLAVLNSLRILKGKY